MSDIVSYSKGKRDRRHKRNCNEKRICIEETKVKKTYKTKERTLADLLEEIPELDTHIDADILNKL